MPFQSRPENGISTILMYVPPNYARILTRISSLSHGLGSRTAALPCCNDGSAILASSGLWLGHRQSYQGFIVADLPRSFNELVTAAATDEGPLEGYRWTVGNGVITGAELTRSKPCMRRSGPPSVKKESPDPACGAPGKRKLGLLSGQATATVTQVLAGVMYVPLGTAGGVTYRPSFADWSGC